MEENQVITETMPLDPKVIAAIIGTIGSLIIAIVSLINSNKALKKNLNNQKSLEDHKHSLIRTLETTKNEFSKELEKDKAISQHEIKKIEIANLEYMEQLRKEHTLEIEKVKSELLETYTKDKIKYEYWHGERVKSIKAIEDGINHIQLVKSVLQIIRDSKKFNIEGLDMNQIKERFEKAKESILTNYQKQTSKLDPDVNHIYHEAKTIVNETSFMFERYIIANKSNIKYQDKFHNEIETYLNLLTEFQNHLRDRRISKMQELLTITPTANN